MRTNSDTFAAVNTSLRIYQSAATFNSYCLSGTMLKASSASGTLTLIQKNRVFVSIHKFLPLKLVVNSHNDFSSHAGSREDVELVGILLHIRQTHTCAEAK